MLRSHEQFHGQKMGAAENSALDLPPAQLPSGVTAKMLLSTAPYNAQNPQTNQVSATSNWFTWLQLAAPTAATDGRAISGRLSTATPSTMSSSGAPSSRARSTRLARRSRRSSSRSAPRTGCAFPPLFAYPPKKFALSGGLLVAEKLSFFSVLANYCVYCVPNKGRLSTVGFNPPACRARVDRVVPRQWLTACCRQVAKWDEQREAGFFPGPL